MYGYIYKTTNLINEKIYIGQHIGCVFDCNYFGSGVILRRSIIKYGIENFKCELVEFCETKDIINDREKYWINYYRSFEPDIGYNVSPGGDGGNVLLYMSENDKIKRSEKISHSLKGHKTPLEIRLKISESNKKWAEEHYKELCMRNKEIRQRADTREAISLGQQARYKNNPELLTRLSEKQKSAWHSEEYRKKQQQTRSSDTYKMLMHEKLKGKTLGHKVINNGSETKKVPENDLEKYLLQGWKLGRLPFTEEHKKNMSAARKGKCISPSSVRITCVTTKETFKSKKDASDKLGISTYHINKSISLGKPIKGFLFEILKDVEVC